MSLFEDDRYQYRETCFVLFSRERLPEAATLVRLLRMLGDRYQVDAPECDAEGRFEAISIRCPQDHSAMDVSYVEGEDVTEQIDELREDFRQVTLTEAERRKLASLDQYDARLDVFHFEELSASDSEDDESEGSMDPGAMLLVLQRLTEMTGGVGIDPQSSSIL